MFEAAEKRFPTLYLTLSRCTTFVSMETVRVGAGRLLGLPVTTQKSQNTAKFDTFEPYFLVVETFVDCQSGTK